MQQTDTAKELIIQLKDATFKAEVIDNPTPILIDFWAP